MRRGRFSTTACCNRSVTTFGAQLTAAKRGRACNPTERQAAGTSSGSPLIGRMAQAMVSSTRRGAPLQLAVAVYSTDQPMPASHGRIRSVFPTPRIGERSTLLLTATFSLAAETAEAAFGAFDRLTRRSGL